MITTVDSSVLLDVVLNDPVHCRQSLEALKASRRAGSLAICPVVWAEVRAALQRPGEIETMLAGAGITFDGFDEACASLAGDVWGAYRRGGGRREHLIPDFLIGAHARVRGARLLARDRGFFRRYFRGLEVLDPSA